MKVEIGYRHFGSGSGVFRKEFDTDAEFRTWLDNQFPTDETEFKLTGIIHK